MVHGAVVPTRPDDMDPSLPPAEVGTTTAGTAAADPPLLAAALRYAARGWHIFPVGGTSGKVPVVSGGHHSATTNAAQVRAWWSLGTQATGIGIAVRPSGLAVLDVDVGADKDGADKGGAESLQVLLAEIDPIDTACALTGGGGLHVIFDASDVTSAQCRAIRWRPGLDWIGDGYIVAAPSWHPRGAYQWQSAEDYPLQRVPDDLTAAMLAARPSATSSSSQPYNGGSAADDATLMQAWQRILAMGPSIAGQGGDQHAYEVASVLVTDYDLTLSDAMRLFVGWRDAYVENTWRDAALGTKLHNAAHYSTGERGRARSDMAMLGAIEGVIGPFDETAATEQLATADTEPGTFADVLRQSAIDLKAWRESNSSADGTLSPMFASAADIFDREFPRAHWLVEGLIPRDTYGMIAGEPKSDKTWAALEIAIAVASNTLAFGEFNTGTIAPVALFLAEDDARSVRNRLRAMMANRSCDARDVASRLHLRSRGQLDLTDDVALVHLIASVRAIPDHPGLVVLDPLRDIHSGAENDADEMAQIMKKMRALRDLTGACVLCVHHMGKPGADSKNRRGGNRLRGSSATFGAVDFLISMTELDTDYRSHWETTIKVDMRSFQSAGVFQLGLDVVDDANGEAIEATWSVSRGAAKADEKVSKQNEKLIGEVRKAMLQFTAPVTMRALRDACGLAWNRLRPAMAELEDRGEVEHKKNGDRSLGFVIRQEIRAAYGAEQAMRDHRAQEGK